MNNRSAEQEVFRPSKEDLNRLSVDYPWAVEEIERLCEELETERLRLAACGTAALGYFKGCDPKYDSASLQDVLRLRSELERADAHHHLVHPGCANPAGYDAKAHEAAYP